MDFAKIELKDILRARDERAERQRELTACYGMPVVSLCLNIAGPVKRSFMGDLLFDLTVKKLETILGPAVERQLVHEDTGCEALLVYDAEATYLKETAIAIENSCPAGRLLDIDVVSADGSILSRDEKRPCIICGRPGPGCARSRAHSVSELQEKTAAILRGYIPEMISKLAVCSLKEEALLTPKPGLVDSNDPGAHSDMDLQLMLKSADSLSSYFEDAARLGMCWPAEGLALKLRDRGIRAEQEMLEATNGVNTHKGAVYGMGLLCFGAGAMSVSGCSATGAASAAASLIPGSDSPSHGRIVYERYRAGGARAEALSGFRTAQEASRLLRSGEFPLRVFAKIMSETEDTNILWRGGPDGLAFVRETGRKLYLLHDDKMLREAAAKANAEFIKKNLSPGGCADILAQALFLEKITPLQQ